MALHRYGDHIDTDRLFPGRYLFATTDEEFRRFALEDLDPEFRQRVRAGDIVVAGWNFGCGSSREQAVSCLRAFGVETVIAKGFARIYFRNAINNGVWPIIAPSAVEAITQDSVVELDHDRAVVRVDGEDHPYEPLPDFIQEILRAGGLVGHLRNQVQAGLLG